MNDMNEIKEVLGQIVEVTKDTSASTAVMSAKIEEHELLIKSLLSSREENAISIKNLNERMSVYEDEYQVSEEQAQKIPETIHARIHEILHNDYFEEAKYYKNFVSRLWVDAKANGGVAGSYRSTKRRNYQGALDYIEAWIPKEGITKLKHNIDKKAEANKKAKESGYN